MSVTTNLGKVTITPRGTYSPTNTYEALDIVAYSGSSYLVLQSVSGVTPSNDGTNYMLLASRGLQGETGQAATVQIGTVTTVPYGTGSSVTNVGTQNNAVLNIELEQGPSGNVSSVDGITATDGNVALGAITYNAQTLSDSQKQQARENIGALTTDAAIPPSQKGAANGVATLDENGKVTAAQASSTYVGITKSTTLSPVHAGKTLKVTATSTLTLGELTDGCEIEIINYGTNTVTLSGTMFVAGEGNATSCTVDENSVVACKYMDSVWFVAGGVSV